MYCLRKYKNIIPCFERIFIQSQLKKISPVNIFNLFATDRVIVVQVITESFLCVYIVLPRCFTSLGEFFFASDVLEGSQIFLKGSNIQNFLDISG